VRLRRPSAEIISHQADTEYDSAKCSKGGNHHRSFGSAVAIDGNIAIIGERDGDGYTIGSGTAYAFDVRTGRFLSELTPSGTSASSGIGGSVAISGRVALIGAPEASNDNGPRAGAAFVLDAITGEELFALVASDGRRFDRFGSSVALDGNRAVIGAPDNVNSQGKVYIFNMATGNQLSKFIPSGVTPDDYFGIAVAIDGNRALIGATGNDDLSFNSGSVYIFEERATNLLKILPEPLLPDENARFWMVGGLPNTNVWLLYSTDGIQRSFIRKLNVVLDISNPKMAAGPAMTDGNGDHRFIRHMPAVQQRRKVWFQMVQPENVTNFVATEIVP